jgi:hypothetical protein
LTTTPQDGDQTSPVGTPDTSLLDKRIRKELDDRGVKSSGGGGHGEDLGIRERLSRLEGAFEVALEGIRHGQNLMLGLVGIGFALVIATLVYVVQRIDSLPNDFMHLNQTLTSAITASKQEPQVIVVPQQQLAPPAPLKQAAPKTP